MEKGLFTRRNFLFTSIATLSVLTIIVTFGQRIAGQFLAWQENQHLRIVGANIKHINPPAQRDAFNDSLAPVWDFTTINGAGQIGRVPGFHNTTVVVEQGLTITHQDDPDFARESVEYKSPAAERYNNASLIGFKGYQPTPTEDVLFQAVMQVSPDFYGTAGFVLEPQETLQADGSFKGRFGNGALNMVGVCFLGSESSLFGQSGATAELLINWWPQEVQALDVNMYDLHTYLIRLHWLDERTWQATIAVDGKLLSNMTLPPFGPLEVQLWSDNYALGTTFRGTPSIDLQNGGHKWVRFDEVAAWTEPALP